MSTTRVKGLIRDVFNRRFGFKDAAGDVQPPDVVPAMPLSHLMDCVVEVLKDGKLTKADEPFVSEATQELFDEFVAPFDIPGIGVVTEKVVDSMMRAYIPSAVGYLFGMFVKN